MSDNDSELLERLLEEFVERLRRGETPSVAEYTARCPEHAEEIQEYFAAAQMMEQRAQRRPLDDGERASLSRTAERLGDYRIVREIGRGGMGIVYEAQQESLGRLVAVKVLPQSALLKSEALRRFEREARTAARLHHSNIIPVFGVGEDQGYHYIVMQLIQGVGLDKILEQIRQGCGDGASRRQDPATEASDHSTAVARALVQGEFCAAKPPSGSSVVPPVPSVPPVEAVGSAPAETTPAAAPPTGGFPLPLGPRYWQSVARVGLQAASALGYAHRRGTLHRDIKPANLLVDLQGVVWIGDFGLAKVQEHDEVSRTGDLTGTLRYMAPERFQGQVDFRSDIYGLGLSLYELLTLRPAYENSPPSDLIRRIATQPPLRPKAVNPRIPADLETIVLKAIAREPAHRYSSAEELADDLERFLDDRPIRARRVGVIEQLVRWSRRNRDVAALTGLAVVLFIVVILVMSVGYIRTTLANRQVREALARELQQRQLAETQQRKAEAMTELTITALDDIFEQFVPRADKRGSESPSPGSLDAEIHVPVQPVVSREVAALLERMLTFYDRLAKQEGDDDQVRRKVADANRRVGDIRRRLGHFEQAQTAYLRAIDRYERLQREIPGDRTIAIEIAQLENELGLLHWMARWKGEGEAHHRKSLEVLSQLEQMTAVSAPVQYELARTYYFLGRVGPPGAVPGQKPPPVPHGRSPKPNPEEGDREANHPRELGGKSKPDHRDPAADAVSADLQTSPPPPTSGNRETLQHAIEILETLSAEHPSVPHYRHLLACCYRDMPPAKPSPHGQPLLDPQEKAIAILKELAEDFPEVPDYRYDLSKAYVTIDPRDPHFPGDRYAIAEDRVRKAIDLLGPLVAENPNMPNYAVAQVQALYMLSEVLRRERGAEDGESTLRTALARQSSLVEQFPDVTPYRAWKAILQDSLAKLLSDHGQTNEARTLLEAAITDLDKILGTEPQARYVRDLLGRCCANLADVLTTLGDEQGAAESLRRGRTYNE